MVSILARPIKETDSYGLKYTRFGLDSGNNGGGVVEFGHLNHLPAGHIGVIRVRKKSVHEEWL